MPHLTARNNATPTGFAADVVLGSDEANELLKNKTIDQPTLDYLKNNNILIPQKAYQTDADGNLVLGENNKPVVIEGTPIKSPGSAYTITSGTEADHTFEYKTADENGNITSSYYKIELSPPLEGGDKGVGFGTSKNIQWSEAPLESSKYTATGSIDVKVSGTETKTYYYGYTKPANYTTIEDQSIENKVTNPTGTSYYNPYIFPSGAGLNNPEGTTTSINNKLYQNNSSKGILELTTSGEKYAAIYGGAVYNKGVITEIIGDFVNNSVTGERTGSYVGWGRLDAYGGAIANLGTIGDIKGNFINNSASDYGGAIYNYANDSGSTVTIGNITGDFINNSARYNGGAIYNYAHGSGSATIGNITGDFINNFATGFSADGGAIYNYAYGSGSVAIIGDITGDFINNSANYNGGAIYNYANDSGSATIGNITGDFINNSKTGEGAYGGAIYNYGTIGDITGDFINNSVSGSQFASGGAIYNRGFNAKIGNITGDFIANRAYGSYYGAGAAIYNSGTIGGITGNFISNSSKADNGHSYGYAEGSAIYNENIIGNIKGDFINNSAISNNDSSSLALGGAIYNSGTIGKKDVNGKVVGGIINSNFIGNYVKAQNSGIAKGGAIYTRTDLNIIADNGTSEFTGNYVQIGDGEKDYQAIYLGQSRFEGRFCNQTVAPTLNLIAKNNGTIIFNDKIAVDGDAITGYMWNYSGGRETIGDTRQYVYTYNMLDKDNNVTDSARYYYTSKYETINGSGKDVYIYNILDRDNNVTDSARYYYTSNNETIGDTRQYVYTYNILNEDNTIKESVKYYYTQDYNTELYTYYILDDENNVVKTIVSPISAFIIAKDAKPISLIDSSIDINGDSTGTVYLNNNIESFKDDGERAAVNVSLTNTTLHLGVRDNVLDGNNLTLNSGTFNMINGQAGVSALNSLTVAGDTNFVADVDLVNSEMDRFTAANYGSHTGNLNVVGMNMLSDAVEGKDVTAIYFAEPGLKEHVTNGIAGEELPTKTYQTTAYTPIYKYNVKYDTTTDYGKGDGGYFLFTKGDRIFTEPSNGGGTGGGSTTPSGNPSDAFNPAVLSAPTATTAATQATVNETFKYVFEHADAFTQMPSHVRHASLNANKYAISTDFNNNLGELYKNNSAGWFRPYVTFEKMDLKHGPKVDAITYGSLAGFDTDFHEHKRGWHSVGTGYIGYNGNQLHYQGVDTTMNGGLLGYTHTMYKNNFWTALTLSAGASVGESRTMYGKEDFTSLMAGVGSKTGYNFEFKEGKYILQPIMFMSYTFANTFDYTNAAGVKIKPSPAHSIQLNPSVRFIANTKNGWQPYASVGMVWNVMNENKVTANSVRLPESSMKPYVEYGLGIQRNWKDRFTAFGQAMIRNGGRTGIALTGGFRWALGKGVNETPKEKVQAPAQKVTLSEGVRVQTQSSTKTVLKQLSPAQKTALGKHQNTTRTTSNAVLKSL